MLKSWISRVRRADFIPTSTSYVCSNHFVDSDFTLSKTDTPSAFKKRRLQKNSMPSSNLRGSNVDERLPKRSTRALERPRCFPDESAKEKQMFTEMPEAAGPIAATDTLKQDVEFLNDEIDKLKIDKEALEKRCFLFKNLKPDEVKKYTGLEEPIFEACVDLIARVSPMTYWSGKAVKSISPKDQLLILLMRLKLDLPYYDLARRYSVSQTTIQNITMTYLHALHEVFFEGMLETLPSQEKNKCSLPDSFGDIVNCRVIIDCTEFKIATPRKDLEAAATSYSNYKHNLTAKFLIGVAPNGAITFVSSAFPGSTSDKMVTDQSSIISHLQAGDLILADKGFLIHDILPKNVFLNLPAFLCGKTQFSKEEAIFSRKIAGCRIHVERAIERLRNYKMIDYVSGPLRPFIDKIVHVCAALVNLQSPIIAGVFINYNNSISFTAEEDS